jgi:hypothetical protein
LLESFIFLVIPAKRFHLPSLAERVPNVTSAPRN